MSSITPTLLEEIETFSTMIEDVAETHSVSYLDAIVSHCEKTGLEIEVVSKLISPALRAKLQEEAEGLNLLKRTNTMKLVDI